jgi:hypothetical protein
MWSDKLVLYTKNKICRDALLFEIGLDIIKKKIKKICLIIITKNQSLKSFSYHYNLKCAKLMILCLIGRVLGQ